MSHYGFFLLSKCSHVELAEHPTRNIAVTRYQVAEDKIASATLPWKHLGPHFPSIGGKLMSEADTLPSCGNALSSARLFCMICLWTVVLNSKLGPALAFFFGIGVCIS